ncbi:MAG TPA: hypothetical protein ENH01_07125 [Nitrospirae bacterium]|nr:hypothetical protein BMS3Abin08_01613 [bacterium BMS3Abin08]HDH05467.1 hypothetical protein [Nitrospirota bacterium]
MLIQNKGGETPRQARLDAPGTLHHIIIRGIERRRIVDDKRDRENFVSRIGSIVSVVIKKPVNNLFSAAQQPRIAVLTASSTAIINQK